MPKAANNILALRPGISVLYRALLVAGLGAAALVWLAPNLSSNDLSKAIMLPITSTYIVIRLLDAGLGLLISSLPKEDQTKDEVSKREHYAILFFVIGAYGVFSGLLTAALYSLVGFDTAAEIMLWIGGICSMVAIGSAIVLIYDSGDKNRALDQAHGLIHSPTLFSHVARHCGRRHPA